ncbi:MAG TPA: hypothetical protein VG326_20530 [Tepidisphaeraceae bacterium]|jgi:hypothetical protein|nr:hypothetical protein [Tepidisphaeraceae bacterium]
MPQLISSDSPRSLPVLPPRPFGQTKRKDLWWFFPLITFVVFSGFVVYATWAAFQGVYYHYLGHGADYISPFYSPEIFGDAHYAWFGAKPHWIPGWVPFSPALLILWAPGGFRLTCYYYRGAYYKAFWADPISCAVGEPRKTYWGEKTLPLILQNVHRYFFYLAVCFIVLLAWDVVKATQFTDAAGKAHFGIGVGTLVLAANVWLLGGYTFGCHSLRHLIGGRRDEISKASGACRKAYDCVSCLNRSHMVWAWCSLFSVAFADVYVRLCAMGIWHDWRIF